MTLYISIVETLMSCIRVTVHRKSRLSGERDSLTFLDFECEDPSNSNSGALILLSEPLYVLILEKLIKHEGGQSKNETTKGGRG